MILILEDRDMQTVNYKTLLQALSDGYFYTMICKESARQKYDEFDTVLLLLDSTTVMYIKHRKWSLIGAKEPLSNLENNI